MIKFTKLLKIGLPVATVTTATIITATLLFSSKKDLKLTSLNEETLENYEKELDPYKEELMKQADEPQEDEQKSELSEEAKSKEQAEKEIQQKKNLDELIKQKIEGANGEEAVKKLLSEPDKLVEELLKGAGIKSSSQEKKAQILQKFQESAEKLQINKELSEGPTIGSPENKPREEEWGEQVPPKLETKDLPTQESHDEGSLQESPGKSEKEAVIEQSTAAFDEPEEVPPAKQDPNSDEEIEAEGTPQALDETPSPTLRDQEINSGLQTEEARTDDTAEGQDSRGDSGPEASGGQEENDGGNSDETIFDIDKLNLLGGELRNAMSSLGIKLG